MKQRALLGLLALACSMLFAANSYAETKEKEPAKPAAAAPAGMDAKQKEAFLQQAKQNIAALNFQEVTVGVLGGQYQKELNNLQQMQAVFCDTYKLDVTKFRQGKYRFDEKKAEFVEQEPAR